MTTSVQQHLKHQKLFTFGQQEGWPQGQHSCVHGGTDWTRKHLTNGSTTWREPLLANITFST